MRARMVAEVTAGAKNMPWVQVNLLGQGTGEKMQIKSIKLENFKGLSNFECQLDGRDASIFGDNATGKTTIVDSVLWLLFDKDSCGSAQFNVKALDANNVAIPMLDHTVEAVFDIGGGFVMDDYVLARAL